MSNELMFYGGMIIAGAAVLGGMVFAVVMLIVKMKLDRRLDEEYGAEKRK